MNDIIQNLRKQLNAVADEERKASSQRFFKETVVCYGIPMPTVNKISKEYQKELKGFDKEAVFALCDLLWQSGCLEESIVACNWTYALRKEYKPKDFELFKKWIDSYINNWASCDTFCNHTVGTFIEIYPDYVSELKNFTSSKNRWMRRAAAVSLIVPAKKGLFIDTVFEISDSLLTDEDDLVQKGYGWMLKVASKEHLEKVFNYIMKNKAKMPRTALRYAIEKMPKEMKLRAMEK
jgi:3-methyladenine DNA glycosylase AlkD